MTIFIGLSKRSPTILPLMCSWATCGWHRASMPKRKKPISKRWIRRPVLPGRHNILRLQQVEQMTLGREHVSVPRTNGGADVFRLAGFLRDDDLIGHKGSFRRIGSTGAK